ncbi:phosphatidylserine decarboxylase [Bacillus testis]|uniref:phosphatidylserine decarboxylase n=1 Tax=Bacillus testis TaxID=1622072 RepID=UPI00067F6656|nr:phosphatidylserine decarboxylase [Bacillus testis]
MRKKLYRLMIELTNHKGSSRVLKRFSRSKFSRTVIPSYIKIYKLNMAEAAQDHGSYKTLHDLFTRTLKPGARMIDEHPDSVVSPVDGVFEDYGIIRSDSKIIVKNKTYSIQEMLGNDSILQKYLGGNYMILYLSPSHYHRIHSPVAGKVLQRWSLGKNSYPVNALGLKYGKEPLSKNFRIITEMRHSKGHMAIVKVGAMFVNSIEITNPGEQLQKGEEFSYFSFGSTVVLLFEKDTFELTEKAALHSEVKVGETLGYVKQAIKE